MSNKYSKEEKDIINAIENGEYKSVKNPDKEKKRYSEYAAATLRKDNGRLVGTNSLNRG